MYISNPVSTSSSHVPGRGASVADSEDDGCCGEGSMRGDKLGVPTGGRGSSTEKWSDLHETRQPISQIAKRRMSC